MVHTTLAHQLVLFADPLGATSVDLRNDDRAGGLRAASHSGRPEVKREGEPAQGLRRAAERRFRGPFPTEVGKGGPGGKVERRGVR